MDEAAIKQPPHSTEAEQFVLGALMLDNLAFERVSDKLLPADFYLHQHRSIAGVLWPMILANKPADMLTVFDGLQVAGLAADAGGLKYLSDLCNSVPSTTNVGRYAEIVRHRATCRRLIRVANELAAAAFDAGDVAVGIDNAVTTLLGLLQGQSDNNPRLLADLLPPWLQALEDRANGVNDAIPTGLYECDELFSGGARRGELIVIGSRPSMGKTGICHTLARNFANTGPVLVLSMEDSEQMLVSRQVAATGRVNLADLRNPARATGAMWEGVAKGIDKLNALPIHVDDQASLTQREVRRKANYVRSRRGDLVAVIVDYLQLMEEPGEEQRAYELNKISRGLKRVAKELNCVVVLLSQLSRKADETNKPPRLDHLAESGGIEQAADIIGLLWREYRQNPTEENKHDAQIEWAKNKNGPTGTVRLWFDGATQRWETLAGGRDHA